MGAADLGLYFALVLGIVLLPGMDMAFVVGYSVAGGWRAGAAALGGVVAGALCHLTMGALGLALLLRAVPGAFAVMLAGGALYLAWLGWGLMRASGAASSGDAGEATWTEAEAPKDRLLGRAFFGAMATNLLNPKAYLFSLAVLPQFVHPERGGLVWQLGTIGAVTALTQIAVYGGLAAMASAGHRRLKGLSGSHQCWLLRAVGLLLWLTALGTLYTGWQEWLRPVASTAL